MLHPLDTPYPPMGLYLSKHMTTRTSILSRGVSGQPPASGRRSKAEWMTADLDVFVSHTVYGLVPLRLLTWLVVGICLSENQQLGGCLPTEIVPTLLWIMMDHYVFANGFSEYVIMFIQVSRVERLCITQGKRPVIQRTFQRSPNTS